MVQNHSCTLAVFDSMKCLSGLLWVFATLLTGVVCAETLAGYSPTLIFVHTASPGSGYQLQANQAPINQVLDKITAITGVPIHRSVLPQDSVTATCVGSTLKAILDCLFNQQAAMIVRYAKGDQGQTGKAEEIWIMGSDYGKANRQCVTASIPLAENSKQPSIQDLMTLKAEDVSKLVEMARSSDTSVRLQALAGLGRHGEEGNLAINDVLKAALQDPKAEVRAQALNSWVKREGEGALKQLQDALQDEDPTVRMMVVDVADRSNMALLQQLLSDPSDEVRNYAAVKLAALQNE